jgi:type IV pilus assembly protein PilM
MAKTPTSVIGVDLGRYSIKSVRLQRKGGDRVAITHFASQVLSEPATDASKLAQQVKLLFKEMGGSSKACAVAVSSPDSLIRIIEQPETPPELLREALRLNGIALLNQDCKEFVLDCDRIPAASDAAADKPKSGPRRYLVGGLPRAQVTEIGTAFDKSTAPMSVMQLAPICSLNAFEFAHPEIFNDHAFFLVDIGHTNSTMMVGVKRELVLVRTIDFGGSALTEALIGLTDEPREAVFSALDHEDEVMVEYTRVALNALVREIQSSLGFLEHQRDQRIDRIHVSGGPAKSKTLLKVMSEELGLPCESWRAVDKCENGISNQRKATFESDAMDLNVACGAAAQLLKAN